MSGLSLWRAGGLLLHHGGGATILRPAATRSDWLHLDRSRVCPMPNAMKSRFGLCGGIALLLGCGADVVAPQRPSTDVPSQVATPQIVAWGTGDTRWVPLSSGGSLSIIHGPQGGYHVLVRAAVTGVHPPLGLSWTLSLRPDGQGRIAQSHSLRAADTGLHLRDGVWSSERAELLIFDDSFVATRASSQPAWLRLEVLEIATRRSTQATLQVALQPAGS